MELTITQFGTNQTDKKILIIGSFSLPDHDAAAIRILGNALNLRENGFNVVLFDRQNDVCSNVLETKKTIKGFTVYSQKINNNKTIYYLRNEFSIRDIKTIVAKEQIDIIIAYNYPSFSLNLIRKYCKKKKIILISDCTEWYSSKNYSFPISLFSAFDTFFRMRVVNKKIGNLIVASRYLENYYKNYNTVRVPFLIDSNDFENVQKTDYKIDDRQINIIYGGTPGNSKESLSIILRAIYSSSNRENIVFRITGMTKQDFIDKNHDMIDLIECCNVIFYGRISRSENISVVAQSDFFIFYRTKTRQNMAGFPTKFVEAISLGTPVITTDTSDIKMLANQNNLPVVFFEDENELRAFFSLDGSVIKAFKKSVFNKTMFDYRNNNSLARWIYKLLEK